MVGERDRLRIGLQAHCEAALRADLDHARRSELVGLTIACIRGPCGKNERRQRNRHPH
jgi:hypothetical protein